MLFTEMRSRVGAEAGQAGGQAGMERMVCDDSLAATWGQGVSWGIWKAGLQEGGGREG